jgi:hypothetical protein
MEGFIIQRLFSKYLGFDPRNSKKFKLLTQDDLTNGRNTKGMSGGQVDHR